MDRHFAAADANGDGVVNFEEFVVFYGARKGLKRKGGAPPVAIPCSFRDNVELKELFSSHCSFSGGKRKNNNKTSAASSDVEQSSGDESDHGAFGGPGTRKRKSAEDEMDGASFQRLLRFAGLVADNKQHQVGRCKLDPNLKAPGFKGST